MELTLERFLQEGNKGINREAMIVTHLAVMFKGRGFFEGVSEEKNTGNTEWL